MCVCKCVCVCACMHACVCVCVCLCAHVPACMCVCVKSVGIMQISRGKAWSKFCLLISHCA